MSLLAYLSVKFSYASTFLSFATINVNRNPAYDFKWILRLFKIHQNENAWLMPVIWE